MVCISMQHKAACARSKFKLHLTMCSKLDEAQRIKNEAQAYAVM